MLAYLIRRLVGTVPVLLASPVFVFAFVHLLPGDPARLVAGPDASPQTSRRCGPIWGSIGPIWAQYARYLGETVQRDLGRSIKTHAAGLVR